MVTMRNCYKESVQQTKAQYHGICGGNNKPVLIMWLDRNNGKRSDDATVIP